MNAITAVRLASDDLGTTLGWFAGQWWVWAVVGVILLGLILPRLIDLIPSGRLRHSADHPTSGPEANELALGYPQIANIGSGEWNDPTAGGFTDRTRAHIADQWSLHSHEDWIANVERLLTDRRRREPWVISLEVRAELGRALGRVPKTREWTKAIIDAGGDKRDAQFFVAAIEYIEQETRKRAGKGAIPADVYVKTLDGYALGQAVAVATWGVGLGLGTVEEARQLIHRANVEARPLFGSWAEYGLSYVAGRAMHWSDGRLDENSWRKYGDAAGEVARALDAKQQGPWAQLPWKL